MVLSMNALRHARFQKVILVYFSSHSVLYQPGPAIVELAAEGNWADEFLAAENSAPQDAAWAAEFDGTRPAVASPHDVKWAAEYLDESEQPERHVW